MDELQRALDAHGARERARVDAEYDELGPPIIGEAPQGRCFGCLRAFTFDEPVSCYDQLWHADCLVKADEEARSEMLR